MRKPYQSPGHDEKLILLYCPGRDWTHDLPHTVASNMVKLSHALNHSATEAISCSDVAASIVADETNSGVTALLQKSHLCVVSGGMELLPSTV